MISFFLSKEQIYTISPIIHYIAVILIYDINNILKQLKVNSIKHNPKKFQFMILGKSARQSIILNINNIKIREFSIVVLLVLLTTANRLTFKNQINIYCPGASFKLHALRRTQKYLTTNKKNHSTVHL